MAVRRPRFNFVTSPSGLLVPSVTDNPGLEAADVTFDLVGGTTDGWVLTSEAGEAVWAPPEGGNGGSGAMEQLFDSTLGSAASSIDTNATLPATHNHLLIIMRLRTNTAVRRDDALFRVNNDSGNNYDEQYMRAEATTVSGFGLVAQPQIQIGAAGNSCAANVFSSAKVLITCYRLTDTFKSIQTQIAMVDTNTLGHRVQMAAAQWRSTSAIDRVAITGAGVNLLTGSRMTVYGLD